MPAGLALDERQKYISFISGHVSFYVFVVLTVVVIIKEFLKTGAEVPVQWEAMLIVPLVVKFLFTLTQSFEYLKGERIVTWFFGGILLFFVIIFHGLTEEGLVESSLGAIVIVSGLMARKFRVVSASSLMKLAGVASFFIVTRSANIYTGILMFSVFPAPLFISSYLFFFYPVGAGAKIN